MRQFAQKYVGMVVLFAAVVGFAIGQCAGKAQMQYKLDVYKTGRSLGIGISCPNGIQTARIFMTERYHWTFIGLDRLAFHASDTRETGNYRKFKEAVVAAQEWCKNPHYNHFWEVDDTIPPPRLTMLKGAHNDKATTARRGGNRVEGH